MARDMAKKAVADMRFEAKTYDRFSVKVRKDSGILEALESVSVKVGISKNAYVVAAVQEKLIRDGYLPSENKEDSLVYRMRDMAKDYDCEIGEIVTMALRERETYEKESGSSHITATQAVLELLDIYEKSMNKSES